VEIVGNDLPILHAQRSAPSRIVLSDVRHGLAQFKLCVHFLQVRSQFRNLLFPLLNRLVLFLELIKAITRRPLTVVYKKLLSAQ
jgi:hypothetical protein